MALKQKIIAALSDPASGLSKVEFDLDESSAGKVSGLVISPAFRGMDQIDRQNMVWQYLDKKFSQEQLLGIVVLVTLTPDEVKTEV